MRRKKESNTAGKAVKAQRKHELLYPHMVGHYTLVANRVHTSKWTA
jgi:hypothetical protein